MKDRFIREVRIDWSKMNEESYLRQINSLKDVNTVAFNQNITFFVGENGTGKSTMLEGIAVAYGFNPEGGTKNYQFSTYQSHSELHHGISLVKGVKKPKGNYFLRAESFYNVATKTEDYRDGMDPEIFYARYGGKSLHQQSHGESFLALIHENFTADGIYILDEPEAALSPQRQLTLLIEIERLARQGSQFIIASHSPILLGIPGADILSFDGDGIHPCSYQDTDSYQVTAMFINEREYFLKRLLSE